ncbi:MAG: hydantoinase/oxoprolinase family protein [Granulosicoccus sp.]|nr:hydantoinase/oxoprolinase family protein [Granulosicoccus sp.]
MNYKLGLDTGGTYTDAVVVDQDSQVVASAKSLTTHQDLSLGLRGALSAVLPEIDKAAISLVSLSTTLATNALVEGRGRAACLILIGYTEQQLSRARLNEALAGDPIGFVAGGHDAAGHELTDLDLDSLASQVRQYEEQVDAFAVSSMFAVRNPVHEQRARELIHTLTGKPVTCGHELSSGLDAPRRALTVLLNARLIPLIRGLLDATQNMMHEVGIEAPLMVVKGDGSLVSSTFAQQSPVETILSGPAASVVGAQFMSGSSELVVSDMGGTTTDIALLHKGSPKLDPGGASVGGWRTMVNAVMINTYGLGGDSAIVFDREQRDFSVGPQRVKPLSQLCHEFPPLLNELDQQLGKQYVSTHAGRFVVANATPGEGRALSAQQQELWDRICQKPLSLVSLFEDQTLDRPLQRLLQRGLVLVSGFTPTDASHVLQLQADWSTDAAKLGAQLLMRYSADNLGPVFDSFESFAGAIREKVAQLTALAIVETTLADQRAKPGLQLQQSEKAFLRETFLADSTMALNLSARLSHPVMGIGAPAASYYPRVGELLSTSVELPEFAGVANALGAVVGSVRQSRSMTITPAGGKRVRAHGNDGPVEFDNLELAASWVIASLEETVSDLAAAAGATDFRLTSERQDKIVDNNGDKVFFESVVTVHATGRPATTH